MNQNNKATLNQWLITDPPQDVTEAVNRLRSLHGTRHIAVMPDVHIATGVCIGTVIATSDVIYPQAVGNDIGCGMAAVAFNSQAKRFTRSGPASSLLDVLHDYVPIIRQRHKSSHPWFNRAQLNDPRLENRVNRDGRMQLGTLGRGNHFLEFQQNQADGRLWLMLHTGSRAMGQMITDLYLNYPAGGSCGLKYLDVNSEVGQAYLKDMNWAREYAEFNRRTIVHSVAEVMAEYFGVSMDRATYFSCDHNHLMQEQHFGQSLWVHRKGAIHAGKNKIGIIPGSMGTCSYHVAGCGLAESLCSSSHGAGRVMSRHQARKKISRQQLLGQMQGVCFDTKKANQLRDEAPASYKNICKVMQAQKKLTKPIRCLKPIISFKGC